MGYILPLSVYFTTDNENVDTRIPVYKAKSSILPKYFKK